jgi:hypothetical protein
MDLERAANQVADNYHAHILGSKNKEKPQAADYVGPPGSDGVLSVC